MLIQCSDVDCIPPSDDELEAAPGGLTLRLSATLGAAPPAAAGPRQPGALPHSTTGAAGQTAGASRPMSGGLLDSSQACRFVQFSYKGGAARDAKPAIQQSRDGTAEFARLVAGSAASPPGKRKRVLEAWRGPPSAAAVGPAHATHPLAVDSPDVQPAKKGRRRQLLLDDSDEEEGDAPAAGSRPGSPTRALAPGSHAEQSSSSSSEGEQDAAPPTAYTHRRTVTRGQTAEPVIDLVDAGGDEAGDQMADVLMHCEQISADLRAALGKATGSNPSDRYAASEVTGSTLVTAADLLKACGSAGGLIKSYQLVGINFLMLLARAGVAGAILADEMGLGKTAQAIAYLGVLRMLEGDAGPHLIVAPASLLENWQRELRRWCPGLRLVTYYGKDRAALRHRLLAQRKAGPSCASSDSEEDADASESDASDEENECAAANQAPRQAAQAGGSAAAQPPFNVMLTCYTLFERDSEDQKLDRGFLKKWEWSHMILDEAHAVKNHKSARTQRLLRLASHCRRRIMLTGTPLQNDLEELQNLLAFVLPDVFAAQEASQLGDLQDEAAVARLAERMKAVLGPFVLRRLKSEVASQLTAKQQRCERVAMTPQQAALYRSAVDSLRAEVATRQPAASAKQGQSPSAVQAAKMVRKLGKARINNVFTHLRKIAQHPLLVRSSYTDVRVAALAQLAYSRGIIQAPSEARVREELATYSDFELDSLAQAGGKPMRSFLLPPDAVMASGKCCLLARLLPELQARGSRPLIFSQWTTVLDVLERLMERLELTWCRLDGSTSVTDRLAIVDHFNDAGNGTFAFLLSTRAGGQGLNLTGADTVILHDLDFNPQIDRQAEDRCHRLGQGKPVTIYRLVTQGTVDEGIAAVADRKLRLDAAVLNGITAGANGSTAEGHGKAGTAGEAAAMGELLQQLLVGSAADQAPNDAGSAPAAEAEVIDLS